MKPVGLRHESAVLLGSLNARVLETTRVAGQQAMVAEFSP